MDAETKYAIEQIERSVAGAHGRIDSFQGQMTSMNQKVQKLTTLCQEVLEFSQTQVAEVMRTLSTTEEHLHATKRSFEVMVEQQGRMLRELAEIKRGP